MEGLSSNLEIHFMTEGDGDAVQVKVEPAPETPEENYKQLEKNLANELRYKIGVRMKVEIVPPASLPRYEVKAKRVFDHRKKK